MNIQFRAIVTLKIKIEPHVVTHDAMLTETWTYSEIYTSSENKISHVTV